MFPQASFAVSTPSRHPANQPAEKKAYDAMRHRYIAEYVRPKFWILNLFAFAITAGEENNGRLIIHSSVLSLKWTIKKGTFEKVIKKRRSNSMARTQVRVPEQGEYKITLQINLKDGTSESNQRFYNLRDFLIVSIGDSFASGEGNPDIPAVPSIEQKVLCEITTPVMIAQNLRELTKKFVAAFIKGTKDVIKEEIKTYLPLVGSYVVSGLDKAEDVNRFVKNMTQTLKNVTLGVLRDVSGLIVEAAEEIASWFGLGDGGEAEEVDPRYAAWQEPLAHRSYRSGHSLAASEIETETFAGADRVTFLSFARSGSQINDGLLGPRTVDADLFEPGFFDSKSRDGWTKNQGQIKEAKTTVGSRRIDALIVTISVNDLGFSTLVKDSLLTAKGSARQQRIADTEKKIANDLPKDLKKLKDEIEKHLKPRQIYITEYPVGVFKEIIEEGPCGVLASKIGIGHGLGPDPFAINSDGFDIDKPDARALSHLGDLLNKVIRQKADEFEWILIDGIEQGFEGHGYCAKRSFFVSATESCRHQGDFEGMLHPNKLGHALTRDCIASALRRELIAPEQRWLEPVMHVMMR